MICGFASGGVAVQSPRQEDVHWNGMTSERSSVGKRDNRFVAEHRGGPLLKDQHRQLMRWACKCSKHVLSLVETSVDERLKTALAVAKEWERGKASVGGARAASIGAIHAAQETTDPVVIAVARSIGQAVATAHMADHSLGAAWYALKAISKSGRNVDKEREWQDRQLSPEIRELVQSAREKRKI